MKRKSERFGSNMLKNKNLIDESDSSNRYQVNQINKLNHDYGLGKKNTF